MHVLVLVWNFFVFLMYGMDKIKAIKRLTRLPEAILLIFSFLFGGVGAMFGMIVFNHKTSKMKFRILVPLSAIINLIMLNADYVALVTEFFGKIS